MFRRDYTPFEIIRGFLVLSSFALAGSLAIWLFGILAERFTAVRLSPDMNGDGEFSVLDLPDAIGSVVVAVGDHIQALLSESETGRFLEMHADQPSTLWSIVLAIVGYLLPVATIVLGTHLVQNLEAAMSDEQRKLQQDRDQSRVLSAVERAERKSTEPAHAKQMNPVVGLCIALSPVAAVLVLVGVGAVNKALSG